MTPPFGLVASYSCMRKHKKKAMRMDCPTEEAKDLKVVKG